MLLQRTGPMPPSSTIAYIIMQFCHLYGIAGMHIFVSGGQNQAYILICRFTAGIQNCPAGSAPVPAAALPAPAAASFLRLPQPRLGGQRAHLRGCTPEISLEISESI